MVKSDKHKLVKVVKSSKCEQKVVKGGGGKESKSGISGKYGQRVVKVSKGGKLGIKVGIKW